MVCCCDLTTAEDSESGAVVFLNPLVSLLDEHAYGSGSSVEVGDLQSLHHLPIPPYIHVCVHYIHTHTHTHTYKYIHTYIRDDNNVWCRVQKHKTTWRSKSGTHVALDEQKVQCHVYCMAPNSDFLHFFMSCPRASKLGLQKFSSAKCWLIRNPPWSAKTASATCWKLPIHRSYILQILALYWPTYHVHL